jgi:hypothetical protein
MTRSVGQGRGVCQKLNDFSRISLFLLIDTHFLKLSRSTLRVIAGEFQQG